MATIDASVADRRRGWWKYVWSTVTENDTAAALEVDSLAPDRTVQVEGTFGSATVLIKGSNDGTNYQTLTDPQGNILSFTSANRMEQITELTRFIKPVISGGSSQSLTITIFAARPIR